MFLCVISDFQENESEVRASNSGVHKVRIYQGLFVGEIVQYELAKSEAEPWITKLV